jgi:hypothetical protein
MTTVTHQSCSLSSVRARRLPASHLVTRVVTLALMLFVVASGIASAQENDAAVKVRKIPISASGPVTVSGTTCPVGTAVGDLCYSIAGTLTQHKESGTLSGTVVTSGTPLTKKNLSCYTLINSSTIKITVGIFGTATGTLTGEACIQTTRKGSSETLKNGLWESTSGLSGHGKATWTATPIDPTSNTDPLAGSGKAHLTGSFTL